MYVQDMVEFQKEPIPHNLSDPYIERCVILMNKHLRAGW